jgi:hypothetical protein
LLSGIIRGCGGELLFKVLGVVFIVGVPDVYRHLQLYLAGVSAVGDAFIVLVKPDNFTFNDQVAISFNLFQSCLVGINVGELVMENGLHGSPNVGTADREISYLDGFYLCVIYACTIEFITDGA